MTKTHYQSYILIDFLTIGILTGMLALLINQQFPITFNLSFPASLLSPSGAKFIAPGGFHFKHWISGIILIIISLILLKNPNRRAISSFLFGLGAILVIDEFDDIKNLLETGEL